MKRFLANIQKGADGAERLVALRELYEDESTKQIIVEAPEATPQEGYVADYVWNQEKQTLEVKYNKVVNFESLIKDLEVLKSQMESTKETQLDLGTQITEVDLNLIEHIITTEG